MSPAAADPEATATAALAAIPDAATVVDEISAVSQSTLPMITVDSADSEAPPPAAAPPPPPVSTSTGDAAQPVDVEAGTTASVEPAAAPPPAAAEPQEPATEPVAASPDPTPDPVAVPVGQQTEQASDQVVRQTQPVNVNVSIRVASPGDNGAVTQVNAAATTPTPAPPAADQPDVRYQPAQTQYQPSQAVADTTETAPSSASVPSETAIVPPQWNWTWNYDCSDETAPTMPVALEMPDQNWNWNWNWNCGAEAGGSDTSSALLPAEYQAVVTQYQPLNVNLSIRVASAGNDGPVTQANVAINIGSPLVPRSVDAAPPPSASSESAASADPVAESAPSELVSPGPATPDAAPPPEAASPQAAPVSDAAPAAEAAPASQEAAAPGDALAAAWTSAVAPGSIGEAKPTPKTSHGTAGIDAVHLRLVVSIPSMAPLRPSRAVQGAPAGDITALAQVDGAPMDPAGAETPPAGSSSAPAAAGRPQPETRREDSPLRNDALGAGIAGFAPAGSSDRNFGVLAVLLLFSLFFVDAVRRVAGVWSTPSAESGGRPEKPG